MDVGDVVEQYRWHWSLGSDIPNPDDDLDSTSELRRETFLKHECTCNAVSTFAELPEELFEGDFDLRRHLPDGVGEECSEAASFGPAVGGGGSRGAQVLIAAVAQRRFVTEIGGLLRLSMLVMLLRLLNMLLVSVAAIVHRPHFAKSRHRSFDRDRSKDHSHFAPSSSPTAAVELSLSSRRNVRWARRPEDFAKRKKNAPAPERCNWLAGGRRAAVGVVAHVAVCRSHLRPARRAPAPACSSQ